jgi:hypothetical protein
MTNDFPDIFSKLQCCHSILNTAWPKPDVPQMSGARSFLGTKLFTALENITVSIKNELDAAPKMQLFSNTWNSFSAVVNQLKVLGRQSTNPEIDRAFNLLYFTSGVLYYEIAKANSMIPKNDTRFSHVEKFEELVLLCKWTTEIKNDSTFVKQLDREINECLTKLNPLTSP